MSYRRQTRIPNWSIPAVYAITAVLAALTLPRLERALAPNLSSGLNPAAAAAALTNLPEGGPAYQRADIAETIFRRWRDTDSAAADGWAGTLTDPALRIRLLR